MTATSALAYIFGVQRTTLSPDQLKALRAVPVHEGMPNRLKIAMTMTDATQMDVAFSTNLTQATISDISNGNYRDLKHSTVQAIAGFFGCLIEDIFPSSRKALSA